jgi:hypothetical protein
MVYPKRVVCKELVSGHRRKQVAQSQRRLVEASLLANRPVRKIWDERTRTLRSERAPDLAA